MARLSTIYDVIRTASPFWLRGLLKRQRWFFPVLEKVLGTQAYSAGYYADVEKLEIASVPHIAEWIKAELRPQNVIDVGCGPGHLMVELAKKKIDVLGIDISEESERLVELKGLPFERVDLKESDPITPRRFDLVISCEVAEHLQPQFAELFVRRLTTWSELVYMTAAEPLPGGGTGLYHYNEQPNEYWIELFDRQEFSLDDELTRDARAYFSTHKVISYLAKPMIFRSRMCSRTFLS